MNIQKSKKVLENNLEPSRTPEMNNFFELKSEIYIYIYKLLHLEY